MQYLKFNKTFYNLHTITFVAYKLSAFNAWKIEKIKKNDFRMSE